VALRDLRFLLIIDHRGEDGTIMLLSSIPVDARSKAWVCGRSLLGLRVRIPSGAWMSVCCECCQVERSLRRADHSSSRVLPSVCVCGSLSVMTCNNNPLHLQRVGKRG